MPSGTAETADAGFVLTPVFAAFFYTPLKAAPLLWYNITAMTNEELKQLGKAFENNRSNAVDVLYDLDSAEEKSHRQNIFAVLVTLVDYLRGDIKGLPSPLSELARNNDDSSYPSPPKDNGDPNPEITETLKHLGELGLQSLAEVKGFKYDSNNHFLLLINNRYADTGWEKGDSHICTFVTIVKDIGLAIPCME